MTLRKAISTLLLATTLSAGAAHAQDFPNVTQLPQSVVNADIAKPLNANDANAVREAVSRVYLAEDSRDRAALLASVTTDFKQNHTLFGALEGAETFANWVIDSPEWFDRMRHTALNVVTSSTGPNTAEAVSYILVLEVHPPADADPTGFPRTLAHGVARDTLRKQDGRWRVSSRNYDQFGVTAAAIDDQAVRVSASKVLTAKP